MLPVAICLPRLNVSNQGRLMKFIHGNAIALSPNTGDPWNIVLRVNCYTLSATDVKERGKEREREGEGKSKERERERDSPN